LPGDDPALARVVRARILHRVFEVKEGASFFTFVVRVYQYGAAPQKVTVTLKDEIDGGI
jgi:hypothetical protein